MNELTPIRRRTRKIGRNESCPCGRTREVEVAGVKVSLHIKYKRCCGKIENQRMMAAVRRHISKTIYNVIHTPKGGSKLNRIIDLFKRNKNERTGKF